MNSYIDRGRIFFYGNCWYVELYEGEQIFIEQHPSTNFCQDRDEDKDIEVIIKNKKAEFIRFI